MAQREIKYQKIINWVTAGIDSGAFKSGDRMPSEIDLVRRFGTSRQTVRRATGELEKKGIVTRVRGSGTYIGTLRGAPTPRRHNNIAVVGTFYESYIFPPTLKGIESVLSGKGYSVQVAFTDNQIPREKEILENLLLKDEIDGLIVEPVKSSLPNPNLVYYRRILEKNIPVLCFNTEYPALPIPCVRIDDRQVAADAARLLMNAGHSSIAGIFKADDGQGRLRYAGYMDALLERGLPVRQEHVLWIDTVSMPQLDKIGDYLMERLSGVTGVVCYNDQVACQLVELALRRGLRVPEDLSVVGIDDSDLANMCRVPLTSFPHPKGRLGEKAGENMLAMIEDPSFDGRYLFTSEPVLRQSVCNRLA